MRFPRLYEPRVSDHAVVRWLERVHGTDVEAARRQILDHGREQWVAEGVVSVKLPQLGVVLCATRGVVTTVKPLSSKVRL